MAIDAMKFMSAISTPSSNLTTTTTTTTSFSKLLDNNNNNADFQVNLEIVMVLGSFPCRFVCCGCTKCISEVDWLESNNIMTAGT